MQTQEHLSYLDGWRGLAILLVLESHSVRFFPDHLDSGRLGVDLFFALSGYLMAGLLFIRREPLTRFYRRRISRIMPAFLVFVIASYAVGSLRSQSWSWQEFIATMTFTRTYFPGGEIIWKSEVPIAHVWSLNVEEHAYVLMSVLVLLAVRRAWAFLLGIGILCIAIWPLYLKTSVPSWDSLGTEVAGSFIFLAAGYRVFLSKHPVRVPPWLPLLALVLGIAAYHGSVPWWLRHVVPPFMLALAINHIGQTYAWVLRVLSSRGMVYFGLWSYSLYLWHPMVMQPMDWLPGGVFGCFLLAMVMGLASYYLLERPARMWLNKNWTAGTHGSNRAIGVPTAKL